MDLSAGAAGDPPEEKTPSQKNNKKTEHIKVKGGDLWWLTGQHHTACVELVRPGSPGERLSFNDQLNQLIARPN